MESSAAGGGRGKPLPYAIGCAKTPIANGQPPTAERLYPIGFDRCIIAIHTAGTWTRGKRV
jgi:hypothetical protein